MSNLHKIAEACQFLLHNYPAAAAAREYLDCRLSKESQHNFGLGYFPDIENIESITSLLGSDILKEEGIQYTKDIEDSLYPRTINFYRFNDYPIIIPYKDAYGQVAGLVGRSLLKDEELKLNKMSKYKNNLGFTKTNHIFGLSQNKKSILQKDCVFLVEGQFDVMKATEKGFDNILGIGSASLSMQQFALITRYTSNIMLLLDNDEAGLKGRKRILDKFGNYANIQNFFVPNGYKDIDDYFKVVSYENMELAFVN